MLTYPVHTAILPLPLTHSMDGISPPNKGMEMPLLNAVFLSPSKTFARSLHERLFIMVGCIGQPLKRLAGSFAGRTNPIQSTTKSLVPFAGGLSILKGINPMPQDTYTQKPTNSICRQPLFNCFFHRQLIAQGVAGALALRFKRRYPAVIVKFAGMEKNLQA
jgi:hypothetical protein